MIRAVVVWLLSLLAFTARGHVGSPDLFYNGPVGPYPAHITIRMPGVVPGRAEISVRLETGEAVEVSFLPLYARTEVKNAPPPDKGHLIKGETNLYAGELWLMSFGAYSVEVRIKGGQGEGSVQIPLTSVATRQLPMPSLLGKVLSLLAVTLLIGGIGIAAAAGREATLPVGRLPGRAERRNATMSAVITAVVFAGALTGGRHWWMVEEGDFRRHLRDGAWPDLAAATRVEGGSRILQLELGREAFKGGSKITLVPDHGKLMHLFLLREGSRDAFAHLHPVRKEGYTFEVVLPPFPEGRYTAVCDLTFEGGSSSTATTSVEVPSAASLAQVKDDDAERDHDDSWSAYPADGVPRASDPAPVFRLPDGTSITWKSQKPLRTKRDASLRFEVTDPSGKPVPLEPYMGMLSHAAVLRSDGTIFAHLHPSGNYSMAAQSFFASKLANEAAAASGEPAAKGTPIDHSMHHGHGQPGEVVSSVYLPYEFPEPGDYRIWVQFNAGDRVITGVFDAAVGS